MDVSAVAKTLNEIARSFRHLQFDSLGDDFDWVEYDDLVEDIEQLSDDIQAEEAERLAHIEGCGGLAFCLFCGERFLHGAPHSCPSLVVRGQSNEEHVGHRSVQEEVS